ncbi:MAG: type I polyketide synthase, partial [Desulfobacterales bacterium]|nr:type I polyketide synthase [Desulfobacterales bacterium]
ALHGFDFPKTVNRAYQDGVRIFLELGPFSSCTRMITSILQDKPHLAISACIRGEDDYTTILKVLAALIAERVPVDLEKLYGRGAYAPLMIEPAAEILQNSVRITIGGKPHFEFERQDAEFGIAKEKKQTSEDSEQKAKYSHREPAVSDDPEHQNEPQGPLTNDRLPEIKSPLSELIESANQIAKRTADAHQKFLEFTNELTRSYAETINFQTRLLQRTMEESGESLISSEIESNGSNIAPSTNQSPGSDISHARRGVTPSRPESEPQTSAFQLSTPEPAFSREVCLEFARGSGGGVLGAEFAVVDSYPARVRLPDEPLMLVDRILTVEGKKGSLGPGRIITEHDVLQGAWYLDGGHAPVCVSVEAGQADLFLCAYLGIDLVVKGQRTYRLLDATVKFHRTLPVPGETIRYEIEIDKFIRQGDTYLFLFHFNGFIGDIPLITMTNGCAGFFTEEEVKNSGGIILTEESAQPVAVKKPSDWRDLVPVEQASYDDNALHALRTGNLSACFGPIFSGITLAESLRLPGGGCN